MRASGIRDRIADGETAVGDRHRGADACPRPRPFACALASARPPFVAAECAVALSLPVATACELLDPPLVAIKVAMASPAKSGAPAACMSNTAPQAA